jgi:hypothetical protein
MHDFVLLLPGSVFRETKSSIQGAVIVTIRAVFIIIQPNNVSHKIVD